MNLQQAITADNVDELYRLLGEQGNQNLLDCAPDDPLQNTPLHNAADQGKTKVAKEIAMLKPSFARKLNGEGDSPMHLALKNKHYHLVRAPMTLEPVSIRVRRQDGTTPLHFIAGEKGANEQENMELLELLAEFLYACKLSIEDLTSQRETAVHVAVKKCNTEAFKMLFGWLKLAHLTKILDWKDEDVSRIVNPINLQRAIAADDVDELYRLLGKQGNRNLLDCEPNDPFPHTPLHDAAERGKTKMTMEIAILKPEFTRKLNQGGHSPMHLALENKHYHIARASITLDPELIRVRGRGGVTPLHFVARKKGDNEQENVKLLEVLAEFLYACKSSIEDLTSQCETAVHVAVKNHNTEAFEVLFGWLERSHPTEILNWKNEDGNTVLHIAVSTWQPEIISRLIEHVKVDAKNFQHKTALEILPANLPGDQHLAKRLRDQERNNLPPPFGILAPTLAALAPLFPTLSLSKYLRRKLSILEKFTSWVGHVDESAREVILVVAALIATATYQAALTPPGGYWADSSPSSNPMANSSGIAVEKPHQAGNTSSHFKYAKHGVGAPDQDKLTYSYSWIEGDALMNIFEKISYDIKIEANPEGGSICKNRSKYYATGNIQFTEEQINEGKEKVFGLFNALEGYL
ncbi:receptor-interacting serine/threonine-protein kinase 4-like [Rhodamnia argentea]|uniref:Receptor-interacting serine/threonine-protein kinase 4-like n=1 Tax=Rhodamnia argentea TaxID=178133 RepID=A0ABM3HW34_9MYRT|nr:receptor-interacting serine/threonine-protein kinase 4-like [Rhodamnia argentea]